MRSYIDRGKGLNRQPRGRVALVLGRDLVPQSKTDKIWPVKDLEVGFWVILIALLWSLGAFIIWSDYAAQGVPLSRLRLITNELSSGFSALIMVMFVRRWLDYFPFDHDHVVKTVIAHSGGAVLFTIGHVGLMMALRSLIYRYQELTYIHDIPDGPFGLVQMFTYEMAKDVPVYVGFSLIIWAYRLYRTRQALDEALSPSPVTDGRVEDAPQPVLTKILVKQGKGDRPLSTKKIEWLQASANYVRVFSEGHEYLVRSPLQELERKLDAQHFVRVHRSFIINLDMIDEILHLQNGNSRIHLNSGAHVPLSRSYKDKLYERIKG